MKILAVLSSVLFLTAGVALAAERGSVPTSEIPEVIEKVGGGGNKTLETAIFPGITAKEIIGDVDVVCSPPDYPLFKELEGKPITTVSSHTGLSIEHTIDTDDVPSTPLIRSNKKPPFAIDDLTVTVNILPAHQETAKILVFWTIRVVGECPPWQIANQLCHDFNAVASFHCKANDVKTYVAVRDVNSGKKAVIKTDNVCTLQIPEMTNDSDESALYDPTITGTYVITKEDFPEKKIPLKIEIQIYWENMGSLRVTSPNKMRNMIVNVIPYSRANK
jgi:hypothetical protein